MPADRWLESDRLALVELLRDDLAELEGFAWNPDDLDLVVETVVASLERHGAIPTTRLGG